MLEKTKMKEKMKRKDVIKNIAIIFLTILLLLTFFSNTIMNYSLPEVATVYVQSGTITSRIRGSAAVEASDPYNVVATESRTISSVAVKVGTEVAKDDIIYHLEETESAELKLAETELNELEISFMQKLFSGEIRSNVIRKVDAGDFGSYDEFKNKVMYVLNNETSMEDELEDFERNVKEKQRRLVSLGVESGGEVASKDELLLNVENSYRFIYDLVNGILHFHNQILIDTQEEAMLEIRTKARLNEMFKKMELFDEGLYWAHHAAYEEAWQRWKDNVKKLEDAVKVAEDNLVAAIHALDDAKKRAGKVTENRDDMIADIQAEMAFNTLSDQIEAKKAEIEKIKEKSTGPSITAPVAGIITSLNHVAGEKTTLDTTIAVIQVAGKGFTASFTVTNEQASRVKVGDPAEVQSGWRWNDISLVLTGIRPDPNNPGQQKELIFAVSGEDVQAGQQVNISVGSRSATYDLTVPNSAIRQDTNSKFILIIETRVTPISNRYYATRVDVEVIAEDDNNSAITAPISGWEHVITTATKPVTAGQQIRLTN